MKTTHRLLERPQTLLQLKLETFYKGEELLTWLTLPECCNVDVPVVENRYVQLAGCVKERKYGLESICHIKCHKCKNVTYISIGKRQNDEKNGQEPFDVNVKVGVGMYPNIFTLNT